MHFEEIIALTMWLMEDHGMVRGNKEDRIDAFRDYLDLLQIESALQPIPRKFSEEILQYHWEGLMHLSDMEKECVKYNAGRLGYARDLHEVFEEGQVMQNREDVLEEEIYEPARIAANPRLNQKLGQGSSQKNMSPKK